jgi:uncharacterized protein involved in type VI secretion and phage assembly
MSNSLNQYFGKYRGEVTDNKDPLTLGRIRAKVPVIFGDNDSGWALPCSPYAGKNVGFFFIPPVGAKVWMEFESGNPEVPIWTGGFWGTGDTPKTPANPDVKVIKTDSATITLDDTSGANAITIETTSGLKIVMDSNGIVLSNSSSKIKLGPSSVSVNDGALEVV